MTRAEVLAYNAGVEAVLGIADKTATGIAHTSRRRVHEQFAIVALQELATAARTLLLPLPPEGLGALAERVAQTSADG